MGAAQIDALCATLDVGGDGSVTLDELLDAFRRARRARADATMVAEGVAQSVPSQPASHWHSPPTHAPLPEQLLGHSLATVHVGPA